MKNILKYSILSVSLLGISGCESFLDKTPQDFLAPETYMTTQQEAMSLLTSIYDPLSREELWGMNMAIYFQPDDLHFHNRTQTEPALQLHSANSADGSIKMAWNMLYIGVSRANSFLSQINKPNMDEKVRLQFKGEALFLRGFYYFTLVQNWGGVPMRLTPIEDINKVDIARTSPVDILKQVITDMEEAEQFVGKSSDNSLIGARVTQSAIQGVLARVYLYMAGATFTDAQFNKKEMYQKALHWAYQVKASGIHRLNNKTVIHNYDNYSGMKNVGSFEFMDLYRKLIADEFDLEFKEAIWEAVGAGNRQDASNLEATRLNSVYGAQLSNDSYKEHKAYYGYAFYNITPTIWRLFEKDKPTGVIDLRRNSSCLPYAYAITTSTPPKLTDISVRRYVEEGEPKDEPNGAYAFTITGRWVGKFIREYDPFTVRDKNRSSSNIALLRYADVLLMIAEAGIKTKELGGAYPDGVADIDQLIHDCVNEVRERAGVDATTPPVGTIDLQFIKEERARELCFEGLRRQDLIRWGELLSAFSDANNEIQSSAYANAVHKERFGLIYKNLSQRNLLYPIPSTELSLNPLLKQNPGW